MDGVTREGLASSGRAVILVDVRSPAEFAAGTVAGARNVAPDHLVAELAAVAADALVVTVCNHGGPRSQGAARTLREAGFADATYLVGGVHGPKPGH